MTDIIALLAPPSTKNSPEISGFYQTSFFSLGMSYFFKRPCPPTVEHWSRSKKLSLSIIHSSLCFCRKSGRPPDEQFAALHHSVPTEAGSCTSSFHCELLKRDNADLFSSLASESSTHPAVQPSCLSARAS